MKKTLKKLSDSTLGKFVIAAIIPGGFIIWGTYELAKLYKGNKAFQKENENKQDS